MRSLPMVVGAPLRSTPGRGRRPNISAGVRGFMLTPASRVRNSRLSKVRPRFKDAGASGTCVPSERLPFRDFIAEEFLGRTLTIGAGGGFFREAVSLSARWLMRAFMLAGAPTLIRKRSQLN